jgi:glucose-6-phosphate isomerase
MREDEVVKNEPEAVKNVHEVLKRIKEFSEKVRNKEVKGYSGKALTTFIMIGIGGSYLGPEFVFEALRFDDKSHKAS